MPHTFAQELIDLILDHLGDDLVALSRVSLIGRGWYFNTRPGLFKDVRLGGARALARTEKLFAITKQHPALLHCTQTLTLEEDADYTFDQKSWLEYCPFISKILPLFKSLSKLSIHASHQHTIDMSTLPVDTREAVSTLLSQPSVVNLSLARLKNLDIAPVHFRYLKSLNMEGLDEERVPAEPVQGTALPSSQQRSKTKWPMLYTSTTPLPGSTLQNGKILRIRDCGSALEALLAFNRAHPSFAFQPTELLVATGGSTAMREGMVTLLDEYGPGLNSITILDRLGNFEDDDLLRNIDFNKLSSLNILSFSMLSLHLWHYSIQQQGVILTFFDMLEALSASQSAARLTSFTLNVECCHQDNTLNQLARYSTTWARLDNTLSRNLFLGLAKVSVIFDFRDTYRLSFDEMREMETGLRREVWRVMPNLGPSGSGVVEVDVKDPLTV
jgi:hypothetical protein